MNGVVRGPEDASRLTLALLVALGLHAALWLGLPAESWSLRHPRPVRFEVVLLPPLEQPAGAASTTPTLEPAEPPTQPALSGTIVPPEPIAPSTELPPGPAPALAPPPAAGPPPKSTAGSRPAPKPAAPARPPAVASVAPADRPVVKPVTPSPKPAKGTEPPAKPDALPRTAVVAPPSKPAAVKPSPLPSAPARNRPPVEQPSARPPERPAREVTAATGTAKGRLDSAALLSQIAGLDAEAQHRAGGSVRERRVNLADTRSLAGFYAADWARKVTRVGELNFPDAARRLNLSTGPLLEVAIRADGSLRSVRVLRSSGNAELDQAARQIVELAAPYPLFPPELRRQVEVLRIEAPWRFDPGGRIRVR